MVLLRSGSGLCAFELRNIQLPLPRRISECDKGHKSKIWFMDEEMSDKVKKVTNIHNRDNSQPSAPGDLHLKVEIDHQERKPRRKRFSLKEAIVTVAAIVGIIIGVTQLIQLSKNHQKPDVIPSSGAGVTIGVELTSGVRLTRNAMVGEKITAEMVAIGPDDGGELKVDRDVIGDCISVNLPKGSRLTLENVGPCP